MNSYLVRKLKASSKVSDTKYYSVLYIYILILYYIILKCPRTWWRFYLKTNFMEVNSNLILSESEITKFGRSVYEVQETLTLPNPEFLTMKRFGKGFYKKVDPKICYLRKFGEKYILPRYYFGEPTGSSPKVISGRHTDYNCTITLRDYQKEFFDKYEKEIESKTGLLVEAPCGHGKTSISIYIASKHERQTLVLVPTYYLAKQWVKSINQFTDASSVILKSTDKDVPLDRDFTVVVMDLFSVRVIPEGLVKNIGHVILDEAHRVGAETYLPILDEIPAKYRTALTATFRRSDGVHKILKFHFGEHLQMSNRFPKPAIYALRTGVTISGVATKNKPWQKTVDFMAAHNIPYHETKGVLTFKPDFQGLVEQEYKKEFMNKSAFTEITKTLKRASEMSYSVVDSYLNEHAGRRKTVIKVIQAALDAGRTILFISKRKDVLKDLHKYFESYRPMLIISETNERTPEDEEYLQNSCPLIFGVTQLTKEGLDIERLDTLILHLPMKDVEQAIGRIARLHPDKKTPVAIYLLDNCPMLFATFRNAQKFMAINGDYKGERTLKTLGACL